MVSSPKMKPSYAPRDGLDWYVEPAWCTELLADQVSFKNVWDPACGRGTIPTFLNEHGVCAFGSDIVDRTSRRFEGPIDFLTDPPLLRSIWTDIVTNPPFSLAVAFIKRAFELKARKIAVLIRLDFLANQGRHKLFLKTPPAYVFVLSRRPSMPPGHLLAAGKVKQKGGQHDYCWVVWDQSPRTWLNVACPTEIRWLK